MQKMPDLYHRMQSNLSSQAEHLLSQIRVQAKAYLNQHKLPAAVFDCWQTQFVQDAGVQETAHCESTACWPPCCELKGVWSTSLEAWDQSQIGNRMLQETELITWLIDCIHQVTLKLADGVTL